MNSPLEIIASRYSEQGVNLDISNAQRVGFGKNSQTYVLSSAPAGKQYILHLKPEALNHHQVLTETNITTLLNKLTELGIKAPIRLGEPVHIDSQPPIIATLEQFVEGKCFDRDELNLTHVRSIARFISQLHVIDHNRFSELEPLQSTLTLNAINKKTLAALESALKSKANNSHTITLLKECLENFATILPEQEERTLSQSLIHGDINANNFIFDDSGSINLVCDWNEARIAPKTFEIAYSLFKLCFIQDKGKFKFNWEKAGIFIEESTKQHPLSNTELQSILSYLPAIAANLAIFDILDVLGKNTPSNINSLPSVELFSKCTEIINSGDLYRLLGQTAQLDLLGQESKKITEVKPQIVAITQKGTNKISGMALYASGLLNELPKLGSYDTIHITGDNFDTLNQSERFPEFLKSQKSDSLQKQLVWLHLPNTKLGKLDPKFFNQFEGSLITVHDFRNRPAEERKKALQFMRYADKVIFTTNMEKDFAEREYGIEFPDALPLSYKSQIVQGMVSNIRFPQDITTFEDRTNDIVYFGHIRANKGIIEVIRMAKEITGRATPDNDPRKISFIEERDLPSGYRTTIPKFIPGLAKYDPDFPNIKLVLLGNIRLSGDTYDDIDTQLFYDLAKEVYGLSDAQLEALKKLNSLEEVREFLSQLVPVLNVDFKVSLPDEEVSKELLKYKFAYLPFEDGDGLNEKSSTFTAVQQHGCLCITRPGIYTTDKLRDSGAIFVNNSEEAAEEIKCLIKDDKTRHNQTRQELESKSTMRCSELTLESTASQYDNIIKCIDLDRFRFPICISNSLQFTQTTR